MILLNFYNTVRYIIPIFLYLGYISDVFSQTLTDVYFERKIDQVTNSTLSQNHITNLISVARRGNPNNFLILSYYINSNNQNYKRTRDSKFLDMNLRLITTIMKSGRSTEKGNIWVATISSNDINHKMDGEEFMLYEGYLFRYIMEFVKIGGPSMGDAMRNDILSFVERNFLKWYDRSIKQHSDVSLFIGARVHMGALWGSVAGFLNDISKNKRVITVSKEVFATFNRLLKNNMKLMSEQNQSYYVWNSTYDLRSTRYLSSSRFQSWNRTAEIQDISHGNHVVQFILDCIDLGVGQWTQKDALLLCNTLKFKLWNPKTATFHSLVNGEESKDKIVKAGAWKVSDGWLKLITYDRTLVPIFQKFYSKNKDLIDGNSMNYQFYTMILQ